MIAQEIQKLSTTAVIELYELYLGDIAPSLPTEEQTLRFTAQVNELGNNLVWNGNTYTRYPIQATGFELNAQGQPPRPKLRAANIQNALTDFCLAYNDLVLAKLTRIKTFARFLDAVNFASGNADANPEQHFPLDVYFVERKTEENNVFIEWELRWAFDLQGVIIPGRPIVQNICPWLYKSSECSWVPVEGSYYDVTDTATTAGNDRCSQRLTGCQLRFGAKEVLPFGGFPAAGLTRG